MEPETYADLGLLPLIRLARELAARKVQVGVRDALPALAIDTIMPGVQFYVFVDNSGKNFVWLGRDNQHPADDPAGAAEQIAADARSWIGTAGGGR